jgi:hypothetical protein
VERDRLFLETLRDLEAKSAGGATGYDVLRSSALLRQLLLDDAPLIHQVNRERRLPITFRVNVRPPIWKILGPPLPEVWTLQDGLDPETAPAPEIADLKLDAFLSQMVIFRRGEEFTVRDVIQQVANILGGIHAGSEQNPREQALAAVSAAFVIEGLDPVIRSLAAVGRVVVRALRPLQAEIERGSQGVAGTPDAPTL